MNVDQLIHRDTFVDIELPQASVVKILAGWLGIFLTIGSVAIGQNIPVKNSGFDFDIAIHGAPGIPANWSSGREGSKKESNCRVWNAPGSSAVSLNDGAVLGQIVDLVDLPTAFQKESKWQIGFSVDILGIPANQKGEKGSLTFRIKDAQTDNVLAGKIVAVTRVAPISKVVRSRVWASSFQPGSEPDKAFDGNPESIWHSKWGDKTHPHWLAVDLGEERTLKGFSYLPRDDRGNGTVKEFQLETSKDGLDWKRSIKGVFDYSGDRKVQKIKLPKPIKCRAVRLRADSKSGGKGDVNASCAEFQLDLAGDWSLNSNTAPEPSGPVQREFVVIDSEKVKSKKLKLEIQVSGKSWVAIDQVQLFYLPRQATEKMEGKANGVAGPDILGAGSYGFTGLMIHEYPALPVIKVAKNSPADKGGMKAGDLIVGINDQFLPPGNVNPGFDWLSQSHEALLGRTAVDAFDPSRNSGDGQVSLSVLRENKLIDLKLNLNLPKEIGNPNFLSAPKTLALLNRSLVEHVAKHQKPNGEWPGGSIHTALGGLALISTKDTRYASQIKAAANWLCQKHSEPDTGFYWHPSFAGIFLCEYFLATGDKRVLPVIERNLKQMSSSFHTSKWGTDTFGHGPRGLPYENKSLVAVMVHCLVFESLAQRCGIDSNLKDVLDAYLESAWSNPAEGGHGALGYNASYKDLDEYWSRTGLMILALKLDDRRPDMRTPMAEIMRKRYPWFRNSHAYGEPGGALGLIGLSQENPKYFEEVFSEYRWWFGVAWEPEFGLHYTPPHMGAPYMEGPVLFNNCYAIVSNIHKKSLHITGGQERNWLKVDQVPVPVSDVLILQDKSGLVSLRCKIPGPEIRYTTDGSEPDKRSSAFQKPFEIKPGSTVMARAFTKNETSNISTRSFALNKSNWRIVSASGNQDSAKARQRSECLIDGDHLISWVTDVGENAASYPHHVTVDLGEKQRVERMVIRFQIKEGSAQKVVVSGGLDSENNLQPLGQVTQPDFKQEVTIPFDQVQEIRYIKIEFSEPFENSSLLMVGEMELF